MPPAEPTPVSPRPAATVLLLRDDPDPPPGVAPLQVFLQRRVRAMAFAAGMTVFPGGGVDAADQVPVPDWTGPAPQWWADRFGLPVTQAQAWVQAAVREVFEECGVLLAGREPVPTDGLAVDRADLLARRRGLGEVLAGRGLALGADLLAPWARWITPPSSAKRYDTAFFVARLPAGQEADDRTTEAVDAQWWSPAAAVAAYRAGTMSLMVPTLHVLTEIAEHRDTAAVLAAAAGRDLTAVELVVRSDGQRTVVSLPSAPDVELDGERQELERRS